MINRPKAPVDSDSSGKSIENLMKYRKSLWTKYTQEEAIFPIVEPHGKFSHFLFFNKKQANTTKW